MDVPEAAGRREEMADVAKIAQATRDDCLEILALQRLAYVQEAEIYRDFTIPPLRQTLEQLMEEFEESIVLKAVVNKSIVGSVRASAKNGLCKIGRLIVHPAFQNQGIGRLLMEEIEKRFTAASIQKFELFTGDRSTKNISFYRKMGYTEGRTERMSETVNLVFFEKARTTPAG